MKDSIRVANPAYRVFIYGHEVTQDVLAVNLSAHDGPAPNQCQITLANELDRYVITTRDVALIKKVRNFYLDVVNAAGNRTSDGKFKNRLASGLATFSKFNVLSNGVVQEVKNYVMDEVKRQILTQKNLIEASSDESLATDYNGRPVSSSPLSERLGKYFSDKVYRYPIADGSPIFHPMDPVRVFFRDPFNPKDWYHMFCGFVSSMSESCDFNNMKTLSISVEDPTKLFRYTRVGINPGILDRKSVTSADLTVHSMWSNFLTGLSIPQMFYLLMFGSDRVKAAPGVTSMNASQNTRLHGIGHFSYDASVIATMGESFDTPKEQTLFSDLGGTTKKPVMQLTLGAAKVWHGLLDCKVYVSDLRTMAKDEDRSNELIIGDRYSYARTFSTQDVAMDSVRNTDRNATETISIRAGSGDSYDINKIIEYIGTHPDEYLVDGGRLMMLVPAGIGTDNTNIVDKDIVDNPYVTTEWSNVGQIMYETVDRIQFCMYCTGRGDIVVEPPMFDADPPFFGETTFNIPGARQEKFEWLVNGAMDMYGDEDREDRRAYANDFIISLQDTIGWDNSYSDEKVYTIATADHSIIKNLPNVGRSSIYGGIQPIVLDSLIPLYGVRAAPLKAPGYLSTPEAAALYASITLDRLNADARTVSIRCLPNIKLWVNRPIYFEARNLIGTVKSVSHSITWGASGEMSTNLHINAVRLWDGMVADIPAHRTRFNGTMGDEAYETIISQMKKSLESMTNDYSKTDESAALRSAIDAFEAENARAAETDEYKKALELQARPDPIVFTPIGGYGGRLLNYQVLWGSAKVPKPQQEAQAASNDANAQEKKEESRTNKNGKFIHPVADKKLKAKYPSSGGKFYGYLYAQAEKSNVMAVVQGQVVGILDDPNLGKVIKFGHQDTKTKKIWVFYYMHMNTVQVKVGQVVNQGAVLGTFNAPSGQKDLFSFGVTVGTSGTDQKPAIDFLSYVKG